MTRKHWPRGRGASTVGRGGGHRASQTSRRATSRQADHRSHRRRRAVGSDGRATARESRGRLPPARAPGLHRPLPTRSPVERADHGDLSRLGVADDIYAGLLPRIAGIGSPGTPRSAGRASAAATKIGELSAWGGGADRERYALASPRPFANLPQVRLDTLLWQHADARSPGRIRARQEVVDLAPDDEGVMSPRSTATAARLYRLRARYVMAADGGRVCASGSGSDGGRTVDSEVTSLYLEADLSATMRTSGRSSLTSCRRPARARSRPSAPITGQTSLRSGWSGSWE